MRRHGGKRDTIRRGWAQLRRAPKAIADVYRSGDEEPTAGKAGEETRERLGDAEEVPARPRVEG